MSATNIITHHTVPEVFTEAPTERDRNLYQSIHSILFIAGRLAAFRSSTVNDLPQYVNLITVHLPVDGARYTREELVEGLQGVHYALIQGPDMFYQNYCCLANDM